MKSLNSLISYFRGRFRKRKEQLVTSEEPPFSALTKSYIDITSNSNFVGRSGPGVPNGGGSTQQQFEKQQATNRTKPLCGGRPYLPSGGNYACGSGVELQEQQTADQEIPLGEYASNLKSGSTENITRDSLSSVWFRLTVSRAVDLHGLAAQAKRLYVKVQHRTLTWTTHTTKNTGKAVWDWQLTSNIFGLSGSLLFDVMDDSQFPGPSVGTAKIDLDEFTTHPSDYTLCLTKDGEITGKLAVELVLVEDPMKPTVGDMRLGGGAVGLGGHLRYPGQHNTYIPQLDWDQNNLPIESEDFFATVYNRLLLPEDVRHEDACQNRPPVNYSDAFIKQKIENTSGDFRGIPLLGLVHRIYCACIAAEFRVCRHSSCRSRIHQLKSVVPPCPTWPGLQNWALQAAACIRSQSQSNPNIGDIIEHTCSIVSAYEGTSPHSGSKEFDLDAERCLPAKKMEVFSGYSIWAGKVNNEQIILLLTWLRGISRGRHEFVQEPPDPITAGAWDLSQVQHSSKDDDAINDALLRAREHGLCPRRIWALALNLPDRERNIPLLVPNEHIRRDPNPCSTHKFCSQGDSHQNCTFDVCEVSVVNFTAVEQCHRFGCGGVCQRKEFQASLLDDIANRLMPTAWTINGEPSPLDSGAPYMAISHVWSDGTGGTGSVQECLYNFFTNIARELNCEGIWWDAICIPQDKVARSKAINRMHEYYAQAECTLVHDICLRSSEWIDAEHACFALIMSNWFTRGWTALELARSRRVKVVFRSQGSMTGYVLKDLDEDILADAGGASSLPRLLASTAIRSLRAGGTPTINDILTSLGPRFTSWVRDRAVIAGLFTGIGNLNGDQRDLYKQIVCKIAKVSTGHLFYNSAPASRHFSWFPSSLFDLPIASPGSGMLKVKENGDVVGKWWLLAQVLAPYTTTSIGATFIKGLVHPLVDSRIQIALNSPHHHILLAETNVLPITRAVLVEVLEPSTSSEIRCRYVGPVYFRSLDLTPVGRITFRISDEGRVLDEDVGAVDYIRKTYRQEDLVTLQLSLPTRSIGQYGVQEHGGWWDRESMSESTRSDTVHIPNAQFPRQPPIESQRTTANDGILCKIFLWAVYSSPDETGRSFFTAMTISHVCSLWRRLSLGAPELWRCINFAYPELVEIMLERSEAVGLLVMLETARFRFSSISSSSLEQDYIKLSQSKIQVILPTIISRIRHIYISDGGLVALPILKKHKEDLRVRSWEVARFCPSMKLGTEIPLSYSELSGLIINGPGCTIPWTRLQRMSFLKLTYLHLSWMNPVVPLSVLLQLLTTAPLLQYFHIGDFRQHYDEITALGEPDVVRILPTVTLDSLSRLEIEILDNNGVRYFAALLQHLNAPNLISFLYDRLGLYTDHSDFLEVLPLGFRASFGRLRYLSLGNTRFACRIHGRYRCNDGSWGQPLFLGHKGQAEVNFNIDGHDQIFPYLLNLLPDLCPNIEHLEFADSVFQTVPVNILTKFPKLRVLDVEYPKNKWETGKTPALEALMNVGSLRIEWLILRGISIDGTMLIRAVTHLQTHKLDICRCKNLKKEHISQLRDRHGVEVVWSEEMTSEEVVLRWGTENYYEM